MCMFWALIVCVIGFLDANLDQGDECGNISKLQNQLNFLLDARIMDHQEFAGQRQRDFQLIEKLVEERQKDRDEIDALRKYVQLQLEHHTHYHAKRVLLPGQGYDGNGVAFTACVGVVELQNLGSHQTIVFEKNITNQGNAYHTSTGVFTAPLNGIYVFHLSAMNHAGQFMSYDIVKDGVYMDNMLTDGRGNIGWESTSEMWALELHIGSEVWIRTGRAGEVHGSCHTMFTGFLLNETER